MQTKQRWPLAAALEVAEELVVSLTPYCQRPPTIAGSIRRERPDVGDIELLCIPCRNQGQADLFAKLGPAVNVLDMEVGSLLTKGILKKRLSRRGDKDVAVYGPLNKLLIHVRSGIPVDIFSTTTENWGMALVVRTGSAQFCVQLMSRLIALGHRGHAYGGISLSSGEELACPTEAIVFQAAGWAYRSPQERG